MQFITLTTDMGLKDHYVASLKAAILREVNSIQILDITHNVVPFDVAEAAYHVGQAYKDFPKGTIHIVGVDTEPIVNFGNAEGSFPCILEMEGQFFISNDNGFFGALVGAKEYTKFYRIDDVLSTPGGLKFPTKNILIPIALKVAAGQDLDSIASEFPTFKKAFSSIPVIEKHLIKGSIVHFDSFGNAITNIDQGLFDQIGKGAPFIIKFREGDSYQINHISNTFNEVPSGEKLALFNENKLLEIAINRGANQSTGGAEKLFGLRKFDTVRIEFMPRGSKETLNQLF